MIAKLIATAPTREEAIDRLILALSHYQISGVSTNRQFLTAILADSDFRAGTMDTGFIADKFGDAFAPSMPADDQHICQMIGVAASPKAPSPMEARPAGRATEAREVQPSKALPPMEARPSGRMMEAREMQPVKAPSPMEARLSGRVMEAR